MIQKSFVKTQDKTFYLQLPSFWCLNWTTEDSFPAQVFIIISQAATEPADNFMGSCWYGEWLQRRSFPGNFTNLIGIDYSCYSFYLHLFWILKAKFNSITIFFYFPNLSCVLAYDEMYCGSKEWCYGNRNILHHLRYHHTQTRSIM